MKIPVFLSLSKGKQARFIKTGSVEIKINESFMFLKKGITSDQIAFWIRVRIKTILLALSFIVLMVCAFIGWNRWKEKQENKLQDSLYAFQKSLHTLVGDPERQSKEKNLNFLTNSGKHKKPPVFNQEMKDKARSYEEAIRENQKSRISAVYAVDLADFYYQRAESKKAKELLALFAFPEKSSSIYHLASFQLVSYYMDDKECSKALEILSVLVLNKKAVPFHLEGNLQEALCLEHLNRYEQALHKYEAVINKDPEGYTGRLAQDYKKLLILNRNIKKEK